MVQQNGQDITAQELRNAAQFVEDSILDTVTDYSAISFPLARGDLKDFPRSAPQDQAAQQGFMILRESAEQAIATLYALAAALDNNLTLQPALRLSVQPYISAFQDAVKGQQQKSP